MYTDDYRKQSYLDVQCNWIERDFISHHAALAVRQFGSASHTAHNINKAVCDILSEYNVSADDTEK